MPILINTFTVPAGPSVPSVYYQVARSIAPHSYWRFGGSVKTNVPDEINVNPSQNTSMNGGTGVVNMLQPALIANETDKAAEITSTATSGFSINVNSTGIYNFIEITGIFHISAWINLDDHTASHLSSVSRNRPNDFQNGHQFHYTNTGGNKRLEFNIRQAFGTTSTVGFNNAITDNNTHHVAVYGDGSFLYLFVDGVQVAVGTNNTVAAGISGNSLRLGGQLVGQELRGIMDEVQIGEHVSTPTDMKRLYLVGTGSPDDYETLGLAHTPNNFWRLGESSGTSAVDATGGTNGVYANLPTLGFTGLIADSDTCVNFNGSNQYVDVTAIGSVSGMTSFTLSAWFNADFIPSGGGSFLNQDHIFNANDGLFLFISESSVIIGGFYRGSGSFVTVGASTTPVALTTYHVALTYDGTNLRIYVNGVLNGTTVDSQTTVEQLSIARTIGRGADNNRYFNGRIDEVKLIRNKTLSYLEILDEYAMGKHGPNTYAYLAHRLDPVGYWRLGETGGAGDSIPRNEADPALNLTIIGGNYNQPGALVGDPNNCIDFNGTSHYLVKTPGAGNAPLRILGDLTVSVWINADVFTSQQPVVNCRESSDSAADNTLYAIDLFASAGTVTTLRAWHEYNSGVNQIVDINTGLPTMTAGNWYHIVQTRDVTAKEYRYYVDGLFVGSGTYTTDPSHGTSADFLIAHDSASTYFNGKIDEVAVYTRTLTPGEVKMLYDKGQALF